MKSLDKNRFSFLVTCIGAYDDSGVGTGGLVCIHDGKTITIDKMDSTGMFLSGDTVYRFVRQLKAIIGYNASGLKLFLRVPYTKDVHDLRVTEQGFVCVGTGSNEIIWLDAFGRKNQTWHADGNDDAWHLNCLEELKGKWYASAFGEFKAHREWNGKAKGAGFIFEIASGENIASGLSGPHHPRYFDGKWFVCESHICTLTIIPDSGVMQKIQLDGFTRGLAFDKDHIFVGESANRKAEIVPDYSHIVVLDRKTYEVIDRIKIPFPEIYDILIIPDEIGAAMQDQTARFRFDFSDERLQFLEEQMERLRIDLELSRKSIRNRIGGLISRVLHRTA